MLVHLLRRDSILFFDFCKPNFGSSTGSLLYLKDITKEERKKIRQEEKRRKEGNYELS